MNHVKLSQLMSYILRHAPWKFGLELDQEGWVDLDDFIWAVRQQPDCQNAGLPDLQAAVDHSDKKRHEISKGRIRAVYGHSTAEKIRKIPGRPPRTLYHGTPRRFLDSIMANGLNPQSRQYVHLAADRESAALVGRRRDSEPAILLIKAEEAWNQGHLFYQVDDNIWLADFIPPEFIES